MKLPYQRNKEKYCRYSNQKKRANLKSWEGYIPKETTCEVCKRKIYYNGGNRILAINFDHRTDNSPIKCNLYWLRGHPRNPENQKIWENCNFGKLCISCNFRLPTNNREAFIRNVINYVFPKGL